MIEEQAVPIAMTPDPLTGYRGFLAELLSKGGPSDSDLDALRACFDTLNRRREMGETSKADLRQALIGLGGAFADQRSLVGFVLKARRHGSYVLMERIYANDCAVDATITKWDRWFQRLLAAQAVRNRKEFLREELRELADRVSTGTRVAVLACGSCREVYEYLQSGSNTLHFDCLDVDKAAIDFSRKLCKRYSHSVDWIQEDVRRFQPRHKYALIYAAGLADYLPDRHMISLLARLRAFLAPRGQLFIGNFSSRNPERGPMALAGWTLYERTAEELLDLARKAGFGVRHASVFAEETGINLFLTARI